MTDQPAPSAIETTDTDWSFHKTTTSEYAWFEIEGGRLDVVVRDKYNDPAVATLGQEQVKSLIVWLAERLDRLEP